MSDRRVKLRRADVRDLPQIRRLVNDVFMRSRGLPPVLDRALPQLFRPDNARNLFVAEVDGEIVSHVGTWRGELILLGAKLRVGMVGCVCTRPDMRRRGLASALFRLALDDLRRSVDLVMVSGHISIYKRAGCVEAGVVYKVDVDTESVSSDFDVRVIEYDGRQLRDLITIYQAEPVRFVRRRWEFKLLADRSLDPHLSQRILIAYRYDRPVAYIATSPFPGSPTVEVFEYAGERRAVLALLVHLARSTGVEKVRLRVPHHDHTMLSLLQAAGVKLPQSEAEASMLVLNPQNVLGSLRMYFEERLGWIPELPLDDPTRLTLLLFGQPDRLRGPPQPSVEIPNELAGILPLPTPTYGMNYV